MYELYISGYSEKERLDILNGGYMTYSKIKEKKKVKESDPSTVQVH